MILIFHINYYFSNWNYFPHAFLKCLWSCLLPKRHNAGSPKVPPFCNMDLLEAASGDKIWAQRRGKPLLSTHSQGVDLQEGARLKTLGVIVGKLALRWPKNSKLSLEDKASLPGLCMSCSLCKERQVIPQPKPIRESELCGPETWARDHSVAQLPHFPGCSRAVFWGRREVFVLSFPLK